MSIMANSIEQRPVISVVDLVGGQVTRLILLLAETTPGGGGRLVISPDRRQLYLISHRTRTLTPVNVQTGALGEPVAGIHDGVLSEDGRVLYSLGETGLAVHVLAASWMERPSALAGRRCAVRGPGPERRAAGADPRADPESRLVSFDVRTGQEVARALP